MARPARARDPNRSDRHTRRRATVRERTPTQILRRPNRWGFELALTCDLILASERARFGLIEATVGLTPAMGGTQRLAERAGSGRARELVMSAERYDATTLHQWGVVNRVFPAEGFDAAARQVAGNLAEGPTRAHAATKDLISAYLGGGVPQADAQTPGIAGGLFATQDLRSALHTFLTEGHGRAAFPRAVTGHRHRRWPRPCPHRLNAPVK